MPLDAVLLPRSSSSGNSYSSASAVVAQPELVAFILSYQCGVKEKLHVVFGTYRAMLEKMHYHHHPDLAQLVDPPLFRGYVLSRLVEDGEVADALDILRYFGPNECILPERMPPNRAYTLDNAARHRSLPLLVALHERDFGFCSARAMNSAADHGDLHIVRFLHDYRDEGCTHQAFELAIKHRQVRVLEFLRAHRPGDEFRADDAVARNQVPRRRRQVPRATSAHAVLTQPDLVESITVYQVGTTYVLRDIFTTHVEKLQQVQYRHNPELRQLVDPLLLRGYILCRLLEDGDVSGAIAILQAYSPADVQMPAYLSPARRRTMDNAVRARSLPVLVCLHERSFGECSVDAMDTAAANGDLEIVQYLHEQRIEGCSRRAFKLAKKNRHMEVLAFLRTHRPQDEFVDAPACAVIVLTSPELLDLIFSYQSGIEYGLNHVFKIYLDKLEAIQYTHHPAYCRLVDPRYLRGYILCRLLDEGDHAMAMVLLQSYPHGEIIIMEGLPFNLRQTMDHAARAGNLPLLRLLHERNLGYCSKHAMDGAAQNGDLKIVKFLHRYRTEGCSRRAFKKAKKHPPVLAFLTTYRPHEKNTPTPEAYGRVLCNTMKRPCKWFIA
ncbi:hypothetical protein ACHHYP_05405 [Achlya hypogyna]|uniref:Ankyrin repeat protein n=1 Tax=Achlya hypogyna TaxID=1202772 RepID=A0A1V9ZNV5_ACHHY|nr:hypothetical protein ACHHYP_05405 [Achlya hypogyna]